MATLAVGGWLLFVGLACGGPGQPKGVSEPCQSAGECREGICHHSVCGARSRRGAGEACQGAGDCRSFTCQSGRCAAGSEGFGKACLDGEECSSATCSTGKCTNEAVCGDGQALGTEICDGVDMKGASCVSRGFDGGDLACGGDCTLDTSGCLKHDWVELGAGSFTMGSPLDEPGREGHETQHLVTLTRGLRMLSREVTMKQYQLLRRYNPAAQAAQGLCADLSCPAAQLGWSEAVAYCDALSQQQKLQSCYTCTSSGKTVFCAVAPAFAGSAIYDCPGYRLPTEAEWEYAYRAGSTAA